MAFFFFSLLLLRYAAFFSARGREGEGERPRRRSEGLLRDRESLLVSSMFLVFVFSSVPHGALTEKERKIGIESFCESYREFVCCFFNLKTQFPFC